jgi:N-acyl-D-amino-acid deacylase
VYFIMSEDDVQRILAFPETMVGSDGLSKDARPHPRLWVTFPRVLGHYARDVGLFSLEAAVHKMSGLTALKFGLADRGAVRVGAVADLAIFDAAQVASPATFESPAEPPIGIRHVLLGGRFTVQDGALTGVRGGRYLASALVAAAR